MSLSGQYLEELSRRYKKQMEEMQKAFNRTLQAVHEAGRIGEEREARRQEDIQQLQQQLLELSAALQGLIGEQNSWLSRLNVIGQHVTLICVEVLIFVLLMYFCRRLPDSGRTINEDVLRKDSVGVIKRKGSRNSTIRRRKSVDGVSGHESPRTRSRRPSEEALLIAGSYQDLLISDPAVSEIDGLGTISKADAKRRRRKKKDLLLRSVSHRLPIRNSVPTMGVAEKQRNVPSRRANSLELGEWWASSNGVESAIQEDDAVKNLQVLRELQQHSGEPVPSKNSHSSTVENISPHTPTEEKHPLQSKDNNQRLVKTSNSSMCETSAKVRSVSDTVSPLSKNNGLVRSNIVGNAVQQQFSSPVFMRTATSLRNSRLGGSSSVEPSPPAKLKSDNWEWYSTHHGLDKSSQPKKVTCSISCPGNGPGDPNQRQNGHSNPEDARRSSNASSSASSSSNISEAVSQKDSNKKGPSSLKKMVKKFF